MAAKARIAVCATRQNLLQSQVLAMMREDAHLANWGMGASGS